MNYEKKEKRKGKLPFAPINHNALALFPHELPVLLCSYELPFYAKKNPFCQSKPLTQMVKVTMRYSS